MFAEIFEGWKIQIVILFCFWNKTRQRGQNFQIFKRLFLRNRRPYGYDFWRILRDPSGASKIYHITYLLAFWWGVICFRIICSFWSMKFFLTLVHYLFCDDSSEGFYVVERQILGPRTFPMLFSIVTKFFVCINYSTA